MAEYIDRTQLTLTPIDITDLPIDKALLVYEKEEVEGLPTADVIERSKIDKAKKQITDSMNEHLASDGTPIDEYAYCYLNVLEILEENIGE